jgi:hypothetical protein
MMLCENLYRGGSVNGVSIDSRETAQYEVA